MSAPRYRLIDHTADIAFDVEGDSWPDLLEEATRAVSDIVLELGEEAFDEERRVAVDGSDREDVLVAWLNEVVVLYEDEGFLARDARVEAADATRAEGVLCGRVPDPEAEPPDRVVKAVTYHDLRVVPGPPWRATIVLDL